MDKINKNVEEKKKKVLQIDQENKTLLKQIQDLRYKYQKPDKINNNKKNLNKVNKETDIENGEDN